VISFTFCWLDLGSTDVWYPQYTAFMLSLSSVQQLLRDMLADAGCLRDKTVTLGVSVKEVHCTHVCPREGPDVLGTFSTPLSRLLQTRSWDRVTR